MKATTSKIIIFGGAFNPPTLAHQRIIRKCLDLDGYDEVWVMPSGDRTDKTMTVSHNHRLEMLEAVRTSEFGSDKRLKISDFELNLPLPTETYQTAKALANKFMDKTFWFVFGSDSYRDMPNWSHGRELKSLINFIIIERNGDKVRHKGSDTINIGGNLEVSSTMVRERIVRGEPIDEFVCTPVQGHIELHSLYRS